MAILSQHFHAGEYGGERADQRTPEKGLEVKLLKICGNKIRLLFVLSYFSILTWYGLVLFYFLSSFVQFLICLGFVQFSFAFFS